MAYELLLDMELTGEAETLIESLRQIADDIERVITRLTHSFNVGNAIKNGVRSMIDAIKDKDGNGYKAFKIALESVIALANKYADLAEEKLADADDERKAELELMIKTLRKVPENGAEN